MSACKLNTTRNTFQCRPEVYQRHLAPLPAWYHFPPSCFVHSPDTLLHSFSCRYSFGQMTTLFLLILAVVNWRDVGLVTIICPRLGGHVGGVVRRHQVGAQAARVGVNFLQGRCPALQLLLGVVQDLARI